MSAPRLVRYKRPGHLIVADRCEWWMHGHVGRYCVSGVGEYRSEPGAPIQEIGHQRFYEVLVFDHEAEDDRWVELDGLFANDRAEAERAFRDAVAAVKKWPQTGVRPLRLEPR